jgi:hypothetical protein
VQASESQAVVSREEAASLHDVSAVMQRTGWPESPVVPGEVGPESQHRKEEDRVQSNGTLNTPVCDFSPLS